MSPKTMIAMLTWAFLSGLVYGIILFGAFVR